MLLFVPFHLTKHSKYEVVKYNPIYPINSSKDPSLIIYKHIEIQIITNFRLMVWKYMYSYWLKHFLQALEILN